MRAHVPVVVVLLFALLTTAGPVAAESSEPEVSVMATELPAPRYDSTAVWDPRDLGEVGCSGGCIYVVGGRSSSSGSYSDILAYNPLTDEIHVAAQLPEPLRLASAVYGNGMVYVFGGLRNSDRIETMWSQTILRFDPVTREVRPLDTDLPYRMGAASAVWSPTETPDGACMAGCGYLFGGASDDDSDGSPYEDSAILRFDPHRSAIEVVGTLPGVRAGSAAVWDSKGGVAYVMGGRYLDGPTQFLDEIVEFDPATGRASVVARLPQPLAYGSASFDGERAYYYGGYPVKTGSTYNARTILAFQPEDGSIETLFARLPSGRVHTAAVHTESGSFILGGSSGHPGLTQIVRFRTHHPTTAVVDAVVSQVKATLDNLTDDLNLTWMFQEGDEVPEIFVILRDGIDHAILPWAGVGVYSFVETLEAGASHCYRILAKVDDQVLASSSSPVCAEATAPTPVLETDSIRENPENHTLQNASQTFSPESDGIMEDQALPPVQGNPPIENLANASAAGPEPVHAGVPNGTESDGTSSGRGPASLDPPLDSGGGRPVARHTAAVGAEPSTVRIPVTSEVVMEDPAFEVLASSRVQAEVVALPARLSHSESGEVVLRVWWDDGIDGSSQGRLAFRLTADGGSTGIYELTAVPVAPQGDDGLVGWWTAFVFLGALAGAEALRVAVKVLGVVSFATVLFSRVTGARILKQPTRAAIHQAIGEKPGISYTDLQRHLTLTRGNLSYHLGRLEAEGLVCRKRQGNRVTFTASRAPTGDDRGGKDPLLEQVMGSPGASQSDLARRMGLSRQLVNFHIHRLADKGHVRIERRGRATRIFPIHIS